MLYELQQVDQAIDAKSRRLEAIAAQLKESETLKQARSRLEQLQQRVTRIERTQLEQELELRGLADKLKAEERRLYSGRVKNPKELAGLQKEVRYLKRRHKEMEEQLLETMVAREEIQAQLDEAAAALDRLEAEWEAHQATLLDEQRQLQDELSDLTRRREELVARVGRAALDSYDHLRRTKGIAVAPVQGGLCGGCQVALSAVDQQRARGEDLAYCGNCGRILVIL
jgi:hypothetical protein